MIATFLDRLDALRRAGWDIQVSSDQEGWSAVAWEARSRTRAYATARTLPALFQLIDLSIAPMEVSP